MYRLIIPLLFIVGCNHKRADYSYKIGGHITKGGDSATWYTDTLLKKEDTFYYYNSDSSRMNIFAPITIEKTTPTYKWKLKLSK